jgi:hypothetical protein
VGTERLVCRRRAVAANNVDLAAWTTDRRSKITEDVVQARVKVANFTGPMITQEGIQLSQRVRNVGVPVPVNNLDSLGSVGVVEPQETVVATLRGCPQRELIAQVGTRSEGRD